MTFVSYAQNFEDVMLWRALKHIEKGLYVDVGAQHPVIDSVSKAFYERGWRGIHIEPVPEYAELLRKERPDETVLQVALAETEGTLVLNVIPNTGLSTAVDGYAHLYQEHLGLEHQRIEVPVLTLRSALRSLTGKDVHWLKIDVEGFEGEVLRGWDSQTLRPWIVLVEATVPNSPEINYAKWDPILTQADYEFVYFDGLNRFYVSKEHSELAGAFSCPPNVFDRVQLSGLSSSEFCQGVIRSHQEREKELVTQAEKYAKDAQRLQDEWESTRQRVEDLSLCAGVLEGNLESERQRTAQLRAELQAEREHANELQARTQWLENEWNAAKVKVDELNQSSHHWWTLADQLNHELQSLYASKSWRLTLPLRNTMHVIRWALTHCKWRVQWAFGLCKRVVKPLMISAIRKILSNPRLSLRALRVLANYPQVREYLKQFAIRLGAVSSGDMGSPVDGQFTLSDGLEKPKLTTFARNVEESLENLSARTARIYSDLKRAVGARKS
jgi:FkbM family methyltransferase